MIIAIVLTLIGIMVLCVLALREDARQKRVDRQLAIAFPSALLDDQSPRSVRLRQRRTSSWDNALRLFLNYEHNAPRLWSMQRLVLVGGGATLASFIIGWFTMPWWLLPLDVLISGCLIVRTLLGWQKHTYADKLLRQLPDTMELITSAVKAGLPITESFRAVARDMPTPTGDQFTLVADEINLGRPVEEGLRNVYARTHVAEYAMFSVTLAVQNKTGGRLAETLQTLGDTVRERVALSGRARALSAEAKLSARVLSALPFIAGIALYLEKPESMYPLFYDPFGRILFAAGLTLLALGTFTMRRMIRKGTTV